MAFRIVNTLRYVALGKCCLAIAVIVAWKKIQPKILTASTVDLRNCSLHYSSDLRYLVVSMKR